MKNKVSVDQRQNNMGVFTIVRKNLETKYNIILSLSDQNNKTKIICPQNFANCARFPQYSATKI